MSEYNNADLIEMIRKQEEELIFDSFNSETALTLGMMLVEKAKTEKKPITIDITLNKRQLFHYSFDGTSPDNDVWVARKNNVVCHFFKSSLHIALLLQQKGTSLMEKYGLEASRFAAAGGAFPIKIKDTGVVGTITVSGMSQQEDHFFVTDTLKKYLQGKK